MYSYLMTTSNIAKQMYHVAAPDWEAGDDLLCWDAQVEDGLSPTWKWYEADEGTDGDVVCLLATLAEAVGFRADHGGTIVTVLLPDDDDRIRLVRVDEGYTAVRGKIPADLLSVTEEKA